MIKLTKELAAARLGIAPDCVWGEALERFNEKRARLYAQCIMPLTKEDEDLMNKAILPYYEALRVLFPIEVQKEIPFRQIAVKEEEKPPAQKPALAPVETKPKALPSPPKPIIITPPNWNLRTFAHLSIGVLWKSFVLFPAFAVGLTALIVTAYWKYFLITDVFVLPANSMGFALIPLLCVIAIEGTKTFAILMPEYWKVKQLPPPFEWPAAVKWLQIVVFTLSVIAATGLVGVYVRGQYGAQDGDTTPATATFSTVSALAEMSGLSQARVVMVVGLLLVVMLDLCIYALFSLVAFEVLRIKPMKIYSKTETGAIHNANIELPKPAIVLTLLCLTAVFLWHTSQYVPKFETRGSRTNVLNSIAEQQEPVMPLYVSMENLKLRKQPGTGSEIIDTLNLYDKVDFLKEIKPEGRKIILDDNKEVNADWARVRTGSGQEGWVITEGLNFYKTEQ
jgi:hypothetical protein